MGLLTTTREAPTLTAKAAQAVRGKVEQAGLKHGNGQRCIVCGKPLWNQSKRSNVHARCARRNPAAAVAAE